MNNLIIKRSQIVEAEFAGAVAVGRRYQFTEVPNLSRNNIVLYGIEAFGAGQLAKTPSGKTVVASAQIPQVVVTLKDNNNEEFMYQMPVFSLVRSSNGGFVVMLKPRIINLTDCYIQCTLTTSINAGEVVPFNFYYDLIG